MRIKFLREVSVELNAIPNVCWGRIQKRAVSVAPTINPDTQAFEIPVGSEMGHCFPVDAIVELPDELAQPYLDDGSAEINVSPNGLRVSPDRNAAIGSVDHMEVLA